jgi:hypothetical protein
MATTLSEVQYGGQILITPLASVGTIRTDPDADHSLEITSLGVAINAKQITNEPSYGAPFEDVENGPLSYVATFNLNDRLVADSVYRKFRTALLTNSRLVVYATMAPGAISATNEEIQAEFTPPSSVFGWAPGVKRASTITVTLKGGSVVFNTTPAP